MMKKLMTIIFVLLLISCSKDELNNERCFTEVEAYEHDPTGTILIFEGSLDDFFLLDLERDQQYALIITYCDGNTKKYTIINK